MNPNSAHWKGEVATALMSHAPRLVMSQGYVRHKHAVSHFTQGFPPPDGSCIEHTVLFSVQMELESSVVIEITMVIIKVCFPFLFIDLCLVGGTANANSFPADAISHPSWNLGLCLAKLHYKSLFTSLGNTFSARPSLWCKKIQKSFYLPIGFSLLLAFLWLYTFYCWSPSKILKYPCFLPELIRNGFSLSIGKSHFWAGRTHTREVGLCSMDVFPYLNFPTLTQVYTVC